jgi:hypothetical protein
MLTNKIPDFIEATPWDAVIPPLIWTRAELSLARDVGSLLSIPLPTGERLPNKFPIEIADGNFIVLLNKIGEGRQGLVYSIIGNENVCIKICRNELSQKQFRRELLFANYFFLRGIAFPKILASDCAGRWIIKDYWTKQQTGTARLAQTGGNLSRREVESLADYVRTFEKDNLCVDWMPSNVIFEKANCSTFETSLWNSLDRGWTFSRCFLPFWIPNGVRESDLNGFPPYNIDLSLLQYIRSRWELDPCYSDWRDFFGDFPTLHDDWWNAAG